jgi:hypothetical protein
MVGPRLPDALEHVRIFTHAPVPVRPPRRYESPAARLPDAASAAPPSSGKSSAAGELLPALTSEMASPDTSEPGSSVQGAFQRIRCARPDTAVPPPQAGAVPRMQWLLLRRLLRHRHLWAPPCACLRLADCEAAPPTVWRQTGPNSLEVNLPL